MESTLLVAYIGILGTVVGIILSAVFTSIKEFANIFNRRNNLFYFCFIFSNFVKDVVNVTGNELAGHLNIYERLTNNQRNEIIKQRKIARELDAEVALALMHLLQGFENLDIRIGEYKNSLKSDDSPNSYYIENVMIASKVLGKINDSLAWYCYKNLFWASRWKLRRNPYIKHLKGIKRKNLLPSMLYVR